MDINSFLASMFGGGGKSAVTAVDRGLDTSDKDAVLKRRLANAATGQASGGGGGGGSTAAAIIEGIKSKTPEMAMNLANQGYAAPSLSAMFGLTNYGRGLAYAAESRDNLRRAAIEGQQRDREKAALEQQMGQQGLEKSRLENQALAQQLYNQQNPSKGAAMLAAPQDPRIDVENDFRMQLDQQRRQQEQENKMRLSLLNQVMGIRGIGGPRTTTEDIQQLVNNAGSHETRNLHNVRTESADPMEILRLFQGLR